MKEEIPQYYQVIGLPIALDIIEAKLNNHEYPTVTTVESDLRRMILNAKSFNEKTSQVFSDAEKVRKAVSNFMVDHNPAYQSGDYKPFPTPVPDDWQDKLAEETKEADESVDDAEEEEVEQPTRGMRTRRASSAVNASSNARTSGTPAAHPTEGMGESFDGDTFQKAQEKIVAEMLDLKNDDDELIVGPFINLPSRELREYYRVIKHPVSLKSVQKAVGGIKGRDKPTGISYFRSWAAFDEETSCIWKNAYHYNEDGSDISEAARVLEEYFYKRLGEAKKVVTEPPQPKVKLRMPAKSPEPPKITLKFGGSKSGATSGGLVDNAALKRQQGLVNATINGQSSFHGDPIAPTAGAQRLPTTNGVPTLPKTSIDQTKSDSAEKASLNGVKTEQAMGRSPGLAAVQVNGSLDARQSPNPSMMPPPLASLTPRLPSGSPHPQTHPTNHYSSTSYSSTSQFDTSRRQSTKGISHVSSQITSPTKFYTPEALISNLSISTHPGLKIDKHFHLDIPPSASSTQQSINITLPSTHYYLQLIPTLASSVLHRPYRVFVTVNNSRIVANPQPAGESDPRKPLYEHRVVPGMNRIEVEIVAGVPRGVPKVGVGPELEVEKVTVYAHLVKTT
ncbi:MAG: hypothetical protein LQ352_007260 [Teloschistes flavicans]|nr:MAG: hypothetical protein LQ352_007260 [Teloschistes flavicans]